MLSFAFRNSSDSLESSRKPPPAFVAGEILVRFRGDTPLAIQRTNEIALTHRGGKEILAKLEAREGFEIVPGLKLAKVESADTLDAVEAFKARADVIYAEPNYLRYKTATPNDPLFEHLWGLRNTGQSGGTAGMDIKAEPAWNITTGSRNVVVAVIDEGIDPTHQDLQSNMWINPGETPGNGLDDDANGFVDDVNGYDFVNNNGGVYDGPGTNPDGSEIDAHGTHVGGIIGAVGNNAIGVTGVNWQVSLMSLKFLGPNGGTSADAIRAYGYAKAMRDRWNSSAGTAGANVAATNNSYGGGGFSQAERDAIQAMGDSGILFVAAAGNDGQDNNKLPFYPATYDSPSIISVCAVDRTGALWSGSNRGTRTVHLGAPGVSILSTRPANDYVARSGTSLAAPYVAGAAALVRSAHPNLSVQRLRAALLFGSVSTSQLQQRTVTGRLLSALGALQNASENDASPPSAIADFRITSQDGSYLRVDWTAPGDDGNSGNASLYELRFTASATGEKFLVDVFQPASVGMPEVADVLLPFRHATGTLTLTAFDNAGNSSSAVLNVTVPGTAAEPYTVSTGAAEPLSTGGSAIGASADDAFVIRSLPFNFPLFDQYANQVLLSTNGAIYMGLPSPGFHDIASQSGRLPNFRIIAGLWDDLDLRTSSRSDGDIYTLADQNRVIFRWQGVPCNVNAAGQCTGGDPVNFEIELRPNGTIIKRYGAGNIGLRPVVGIGGERREAYLIASHTSEASPTNLTNAPTITYTLNDLPNVSDLNHVGSSSPDPVRAGGTIRYTVRITNNGPDRALGVKSSLTPDVASQFLSCATTHGHCARATGGTVFAAIGALAAAEVAVFEVVVTAPLIKSYRAEVVNTLLTFDPTNLNSSTIHTETFQDNPRPLTGIISAAAGNAHRLALTADGSVLAWGENNFGQLGDTTNLSRLTPVWVHNLNSVSQIATGHSHSVAVKPSGKVFTWGYNFFGSLGDGTTLDRNQPVQVPNFTAVSAAAGLDHTIALRSDGTVWAWGRNTDGQLGDGTNTNRPSPVKVTGLSGVVGIAARASHSIALRSDGTVWTWGRNAEAQLGDGTTTSRNVPVQVVSLSGVVQVSAGINFMAALKADGSVWAWGQNEAGQLGDGTRIGKLLPVQTAISNVSSIACGFRQVLALKTDQSLWAWGGGSLGMGFTVESVTTPQQPIVLTSAAKIAAGGNSLAITNDGTLYWWGPGARDYPYQADAGPARTAIDTPVFSPDGGTFSGPQAVTITLPGGAATLESVSLGGVFSLGLLSNGQVYAWGHNDRGQVGLPPPFSVSSFAPAPVPISGLDSITAVAAGESHAVARRSDGTVWCWGSNFAGQLGNGGSQDTNLPTKVSGLNNISKVAASTHTLALSADGTIWAWGTNSFGQLGLGHTGEQRTPAQVPGLNNVKAIAAGSGHSIALKHDGSVWVWGWNLNGQLGNGTTVNSITPIPVNGLTNVIDIAAGNQHSVALLSNGTLMSWGANQDGELGDGTNARKLTPVTTVGLNSVVLISAQSNNTTALKSDGTVWKWGRRFNGSLGTPVTAPSNLPAQVILPITAVTIGTGGGHGAARSADGALWMWGFNLWGQIGDNTTSDRHTAVKLGFFQSGPTLHYTTNGSDPTDDDPIVAVGGTVVVGQSGLLRARAFRSGFAPSGIKTASYAIAGSNPIDDSRFFIRQHYLDFLGREPDQGGWDYWTAQITICGSDTLCIHRRRIDVSAAFFIELEFQRTGSFIYRMFKGGLGRRPEYAEFNADRALIVEGPTLEQTKQAYALQFVGRSEFISKYSAMNTAESFVDALLASIQQNSMLDLSSIRSALIAKYNTGSDQNQSRALALQDAINHSIFTNGEYHASFVTMQYFGYLIRSPEQGGYLFWLDVLNNRDPNNYRGMVCSFLTSAEYQQRFGQTVTRTNADCSLP